jgi:ABC-2 type transport system ATP-binding protein
MKVEIENLKRHFGRTKAVDGVSFAFDAGHVMGFIGPNGAGKTTTLRIIATLDEPGDGDARVDGVSVREDPEKVRRLVGFVPDTLPAQGDMTVHEYLDFFARAYGMRGRTRDDAVQAVKEFTRVDRIEDKTLKSLSKGMKQRVSLGRALVHDPAVLIMDEPTAGLDPRARIEFRELITVLSEQGKAILISSHILSELQEFCNAVVIIERGRILDAGLLTDVVTRDRQRLSIVIRALDNLDGLQQTCLQLPGVQAARRAGACVEVELEGDEAQVAALLAEIVRRGHRLLEFRPSSGGLEDVFLRVTKGDLQ